MLKKTAFSVRSMVTGGVDVGHRIRDFRRSRGLALKQVAEGAGVSVSLVSQIENNRVDPSLSTLRKIALTMGVPVFTLIAESSPEGASLVPKEKRRRNFERNPSALSLPRG